MKPLRHPHICGQDVSGKTLAENKTIVFRADTHTDTMSVEYADFEKLVRPTVAEFAQAANA